MKKTIWCLSIVIVFIFISFTTANAFSDYEQNVSRDLINQLSSEYDIYRFAEGSRYQIILDQLEKHIRKNEFRELGFNLHQIDSHTINAYYVGAGNIMLFTGLLDLLETDAEIAAVIAHEMGHGVEEHMEETFERRIGLSIIGLIFNEVTDNQYDSLANITQGLLDKGFSRKQEKEADLYATDLLVRAGYSSQGIIDLMNVFKEQEAINFKLFELLQTHPQPETRLEYINEHLYGKEDGTISKEEIKKPGPETPLNNYYQGKYFKMRHPDQWKIRIENSYVKNILQKISLVAAAKENQAEIQIKDMRNNDFMNTAEKLWRYDKIISQEKDSYLNSSEVAINGLQGYQLMRQVEKNGIKKNSLTYYLAFPDVEYVMLIDYTAVKAIFAENRAVIEMIINSITIK